MDAKKKDKYTKAYALIRPLVMLIVRPARVSLFLIMQIKPLFMVDLTQVD